MYRKTLNMVNNNEKCYLPAGNEWRDEGAAHCELVESQVSKGCPN